MLELEEIQTDIVSLLEESMDLVKYAAARKGLELLLRIDPSLPRFAITDPVRLKQVLANLLGNAVKFTKKGEVELSAFYTEIGKNKGNLSFSVRDTGVGISEKQKANLFKAFSQADNSTTREYGGTGLGLVISELIAQKMGSRIRFESEVGQGAVFSFDVITETAPGAPLRPNPIPGVSRCLIIDDNARNRTILAEMISGWGITCECCSDGLSSLKALGNAEAFDFILCDYHMPYMDGVETARVLREKLNLSAEQQPVVLMHSSTEDSAFHLACDELGIRFRISKPVKQSALFETLCRIHAPHKPGSAALPVAHDPRKNPHSAYHNKKILIAEDVPMNLNMLKIILHKVCPGVELLAAANGREMVEQYQSVSPDLVLMDVQMPVMDGLEATKRIRAIERMTGRHVPIIAVTAGALIDEQEKCTAAGMDDFVAKPIQKEKLVRILRTHMPSSLCIHSGN